MNFSNASFTFLNCIGDLILGDLQGLDADAGGYVVMVGDGRAAYVVGGGVGGGDDCGGGGGDGRLTGLVGLLMRMVCRLGRTKDLKWTNKIPNAYLVALFTQIMKTYQ